MQQEIFGLGLSVPATSLYLMLEHFLDSNIPMIRENCTQRWTLSDAELDQAISELAMHEVVRPQGEFLEVLPVSMWKAAKGDIQNQA